MLKKPILRIFLATIFLIISLTFIIKYINKKDILDSIKANDSNEEIIHNSNIIKDLNYTSKDLQGNEYIIFAKEGEIDLKNTDIIFLKDVTAYIKLQKKSETIIITSDYGKYNSIIINTIIFSIIRCNYYCLRLWKI